MKKIFSIKNFILLITIVVLAGVIYGEYSSKKKMYYQEKIYDLKLQYNDKIISNQRVVEALFDEIFIDEEIGQILFDSSNKINISKNRNHLYKKLQEKYERMKQKGILQFHFHLSNGDSFLRFHKLEKYGDSILFRQSIQKVRETQKPVVGFEVGKYFDGFRYVYPIFYKGEYAGSFETSISARGVLKQMKESLDSKYSMVLKSELVDGVITKEHIKKHYHKFCVDKRYYMANAVHKEKSLARSALKKIKPFIYENIQDDKPFAKEAKDSNGDMKLFIFIPIVDVQNKKAGYVFSIREDSFIENMQNAYLIKFLVGFVLILFVSYFYRESKQKTNTIKQLQNAIDKTTLVSKTDLKGRITYVNDAFEKISGYTKKELLGKSHSIVKDPSVSKEVFQELWNTIQNKKVWHGTIPNKTKDGIQYIVDATIIPILDINNEIQEYVAIRHDVTELERYKEVLKEQLHSTKNSLNENITYAKQYEEALNNSVAVLKTDTKNIITHANEKFCKISGYTLDELVGKECSELRHENHIKAKDCEKIAQKLKTKETISLVFTNIAKNGELFFCDTFIYPIVDLENSVTEHLHLMHDISEIINLHQELEDTQKEIIYRMGEIGETRSKETGNHVKRVAEYSKRLAILYGLSEKEAEMLKLASPMHDIGKVGIPDSVLNKPGKLDKNEWEIMQTHAELGFEMLKHSNRPILKTAAIVSGEHHEKWDGSGYPKGLAGEDIHIYGRITAIADVFDALGSDRCYKQAWELEKILKLFEDEKGKHFDPKLIELFFDNLDDFLKIRDKFKD